MPGTLYGCGQCNELALQRDELAEALREAVEAMELARCGAQISMESIDRARAALAKVKP